MHRDTLPSGYSRWESGAPVMRQGHRMSPEVQALLRLKELEVREIYGEGIERLLDLAEKRARALRQLFYAEEAFRRAIDPELGHEEKELQIKRASAQLREALGVLQQTRYPERQEFAPRQQALDADIARAKALQEAVEVWWWRRFSEGAAEFNRQISLLPEEKSLGDAAQVLDKVKTVFQSWPIGGRAFSWRQQAKDSVDEMENRLKMAWQEHLHLRLREATYWLNEAAKYLPARRDGGNYSGPTFPPQQKYGNLSLSQPGHMSVPSAPTVGSDPFAALACLTRAEMILDDLQKKIHQDAVSSELHNKVNKAQERLTSLWDEARQYLVQWLTDRRRDDFSKMVRGLDYDSHTGKGDLLGFLKGKDEKAKTRRELLDKICLHLYLDPTVEALDSQQDKWLRKLVLIRHDNLLRAQQLLREVKARWNVEGKERRPYIYWAWQKMNEAFDCDPDSEGVQISRDEIDRQWVELRDEFQGCASATDNSLRSTFLTLDKPGAVLSRAKETLDKAKELLDSQAERPPDWEEQIRKLEDHLGLFEQANAIAGQWDDPDSDPSQLALATQSFLQQSDLPDSIRSFLSEHIRNQKVGWSRVRPSLALSLVSEISRSL